MDRGKWYGRTALTVVFVMLVALVAVAAAGCGDPAKAGSGPFRLGEQDNGKSFTVKAGETIEVVLPGNPTTGYAWTAALGDDDAALLEQVGEAEYVADPVDEDVVGSGGNFTLTFKAAAAGEAALTLIYSRSFEDAEPLETFEAQITIE